MKKTAFEVIDEAAQILKLDICSEEFALLAEKMRFPMKQLSQ